MRIVVVWCFIAPRAPHQRCTWKVTGKSMKFYLNGVVGAQTLNSEEFQTDLGLNKSFIARRPMGKAFRKAHSGGHQDHSGPSHILSSILVEMESRIPHR